MVSKLLCGVVTFHVFMLGCGAAVAQATPPTTGPTAPTQAQATRSPAGPTAPTQAIDFHNSNPSSPQLLQERHPRYQVMPSDVLAVTFPLTTELNQTVTVQPDGFINLANVGGVYVQGQTTSEIIETLHKAYEHILHNPIIAVDVTNFQRARFTIFGHVGRPGEYELRYDITVSQAIAMGGGFLASAKSQAFLLRRVSTDWVEVKKLNLKPLTHGKNLPEDVYLQPGDMIYVPETVVSKFRRYIPYGGVSAVNPLGVESLITQND